MVTEADSWPYLLVLSLIVIQMRKMSKLETEIAVLLNIVMYCTHVAKSGIFLKEFKFKLNKKNLIKDVRFMLCTSKFWYFTFIRNLIFRQRWCSFAPAYTPIQNLVFLVFSRLVNLSWWFLINVSFFVLAS